MCLLRQLPAMSDTHCMGYTICLSVITDLLMYASVPRFEKADDGICTYADGN